MQRLFKYLFLWMPALCIGQKNISPQTLVSNPIDLTACQSHFKPIQIGDPNSKNIIAYLSRTHENFKTSYTSLAVIDSTISKTGKHFLFQQHYNGIPVYRGHIKVNASKQGTILSMFDNTHPAPVIPNDFFPENVKNQYVSSLTNTQRIKTEKNYFPSEEGYIPVWRIEVFQNYTDFYEVLLDRNGNIIYYQDLNSYFSAPKDSTVSAFVFMPDPLTTANVVYGSPYIDNNDNDISQLNSQRVSVNMTVQYSGDTFYLKNNYAKIVDIETPSIPPAYSVGSPVFNYTRSQDGFEDVNAFYHISTFREHIQNLGFTTLVNYPINIDVHAMNGQDNSQFSPADLSLRFGEGGVDDAEDADVVIHEFGHAISFSAAPNTNNGTERKAIDEAIGDYLASSYSRSLNSYKWDNVFSWDGHNEFWAGRSSISIKHYPQNLKNNLYDDADIWSSTLMEIWGDIGRNTTDEILLESLYGYASNMTMVDAARLFILADSALYNGLHYTSICTRFYNRGLISACTSSIPTEEKAGSPVLINSEGFSIGETATFNFIIPENVLIRIVDIQGKCIQEASLQNSSSFELEGSAFNSGLYLVSIQTNHGRFNFKLVRF